MMICRDACGFMVEDFHGGKAHVWFNEGRADELMRKPTSIDSVSTTCQSRLMRSLPSSFPRHWIDASSDTWQL